MPPEEIRKITERIGDYFGEASALPAELRSDYLDQRLDPADPADAAVRAEVERLLRHHDATGFLDRGAIRRPAPAAVSADEAGPALQEGELAAGRFRVVSMLGSGGMGEVYEVEDLKTRRSYALKTIRPEIAEDEAQAERFRRELLIAREILRHRNVCEVYEYHDIDRGERGRLRFFTMKLLRGETLARRMARVGRMAPRAALAILEQVAAGIGEVHRCGIVHRDLKPSNIFLVAEEDGSERAVVMDFGLARSLSEEELRQTRTGMAMGTLLYMPPETTRAAGVAGDVYSFGVIAFEMVTGAASPLVAPRSVVPALDPAWDRAILASVNADPAKRPATLAEAMRMLRRRMRLWQRIGAGAVAAAVCAALGFAAWKVVNPGEGPVGGTRQLTFDSGTTVDPAGSADGKLLAYASDRYSPGGDLNIWLQNLETNSVRQITSGPDEEDEPALSPDGRLIAWHSGNGDAVYLREVAGGREREIARPGFAPRFSPDGRYIAYWQGAEGYRGVPAKSWVVSVAGDRRWDIAPGFRDARQPGWSADGKWLLFRGAKDQLPAARQAEEFWLASIDGKTLRATGLGKRLRDAQLEDHDSPVLWAGNRLVFAARAETGINLWSIGLISFPPLALGSPQMVTTGGSIDDVPALLPGPAVAYASLETQIHVFSVDPDSDDLTQLTDAQSLDTRVSASSDGAVLVFGRRVGPVRNIWTRDLRLPENNERELAHNEFAVPFVSPDGKTVAISAGRTIRLIDIATAHQRPACSDCGELQGWMPESRRFLYLDETGIPTVRARDARNGATTTLFAAAGLNDVSVSPNGRWVAFAISSGANSRIFAAKLASAGSTREWTPVTPEQGWADKPAWSNDFVFPFDAGRIPLSLDAGSERGPEGERRTARRSSFP